MNAHTPGPWQWFNYGDRKLLAADSRAVIHCPDAQIACDAADQSIIAAAPDLLAALKILQTCFPSAIAALPDEQRAIVNGAIAKAEGR